NPVNPDTRPPAKAPTRIRSGISVNACVAAERGLAARAPLADHAKLFHVAQRRELRDADLDPRRFEFSHDGVGDRFAGFFEQQKMLLLEELLDAPDDTAVVDSVADLAALRRVLAAQADFEVELDSLRDGFFPVVNTDQRFDLKFADEYDVHVNTGEAVGEKRRTKISIAAFFG